MRAAGWEFTRFRTAPPTCQGREMDAKAEVEQKLARIAAARSTPSGARGPAAFPFGRTPPPGDCDAWELVRLPPSTQLDQKGSKFFCVVE